MWLVVILYAIATVILAVYGFNGIVLTANFVWRKWIKRDSFKPTPPPAVWPTVTIQLPTFNERYVVERLIDAVAALDYPTDRLHIQVLDDSTDDTAMMSRTRVAHYRARGINIEYIQRPQRKGYKAGALTYGLSRSTAEFVGVFDADFVPAPDYLKKVMAEFTDPNIGMVQTRWAHLNEDYSWLTRAQALALDGHFGIEQEVRSETGLFMNFNGSAGIWRRACIDDAGGWDADTIAEDLDLSYRAQLRGWRFRYLPHVSVPAEIPTLLAAVKRQQFRWAKGSIQGVIKNSGRLINSPEPLIRKLEGLLHLTGYVVHPLMMLVITLSLPLIVTGEISRTHIGAIGLAGFGPPLMFLVAQIALNPKDWYKHVLFLPTILLLGPGLALNNTAAIAEALIGRNPTLFLRTPKLQVQGKLSKDSASYNIPVDWTTWAELFFMFYSAITTAFALQHAPSLVPFMASYAIGFGYTAYLGLRQSFGISPKSISSAVPNE
jgi:cellulose synthase/poly-beta-1,6-N-acetylglucosamine synthase-like glycosyltransferase